MTALVPGPAERVAANKRRAAVLVAITAAAAGLVVAAISMLILRPAAAVVVWLVVGVAWAAVAWWGSEALVRRLVPAEPADPVTHARLFNLIDGLCTNAGVPPPALYLVVAPGLNVLTMGRHPRRAALVVTTGLLDRLSRIELEAVLAHELSHIKGDDILTATVAVTLFGVLAGPARAAAAGGPGSIPACLLVPVAALAGLGLQAAIGSRREEVADLAGASLTRYPPAMVAALEKLQGSGTLVPMASVATAHLWLAPAVPPPPPVRLTWLSRLFETHSPLNQRIEALREL